MSAPVTPSLFPAERVRCVTGSVLTLYLETQRSRENTWTDESLRRRKVKVGVHYLNGPRGGSRSFEY